MKNKKRVEVVEYHQHTDKRGSKFGKAHAVNKMHPKQSTQKAHEITIKLDKER